MAFSTYTELKADVAGYLGRSDLNLKVEDFIRMAEIRLRRVLRIRAMLSQTTLSTVASTAAVALPSDFLQLRELHISSTPVGTLAYNAPTAFYGSGITNVTGRPEIFTSIGSNLVLARIPDSVYNLSLLYYQKPLFLSSSNASNVFLTEAPDALLYAALGEAEPYLMSDERLTVWAGLFERALSDLSSSDDAAEFAGNPLRMQVV